MEAARTAQQGPFRPEVGAQSADENRRFRRVNFIVKLTLKMKTPEKEPSRRPQCRPVHFGN